ncbi:MAG TPA: SDR family oxidoreductase [Caldilineae bacterium]|nr:SDR family oxidoreductase [Caldilineae bacterium]
MPSQLFLTGANRGIGLAIVQEALTRGYRIFAGARRPHQARELQALAQSRPDQLTLIPIDVSDDDSIQAAADQVRAHADRLDVLINNAGVFPRGERLDNLDSQTMLRTYRVNSIGPMIVTQRFHPLLQAGSKVLNITSQLGSITLHMSNHYSYNSSKAALNMLTRILASELRPEGVIAVVAHPGWVQTDMGGPAAPISPAASARGILNLAERLTPADSGEFFTWEGKKHPW